MRRRKPSVAVRVFRIGYWTLAAVLGMYLAFRVPSRHSDLAVNQMTVFFYAAAAAAVYKLLLRFAFHLGAGDAVEREIRESEGRVELKLDDRDDGWGP